MASMHYASDAALDRHRRTTWSDWLHALSKLTDCATPQNRLKDNTRESRWYLTAILDSSHLAFAGTLTVWDLSHVAHECLMLSLGNTDGCPYIISDNTDDCFIFPPP